MPKINQTLFFRIASPDESEAAAEYKARIADEREDALLIETPINEATGRLKRLFPGDELSASFVMEDGIKYAFDSRVLGLHEDAVKLVMIRKPDPERISKIQRRSFLRVPAELEVAVKLSGGERMLCKTDDVGGGGISFLCEAKRELAIGQKLECWLLLPYRNGSIDHIFFISEIVRIAETKSGRLQAMSKFVGIGDAERQKMIRFCLERQLDFRHR